MIATLPAAALIAFGLGAAPPEAPGTAPPILVEAIVEAPPAEVFQLWTTPAGVQKFFAADARIDARTGGRYEIIFNPTADPEGARAGTKGAKILHYEPDRRLDFEWSVGVPDVSWDLRPMDFATHVELSLEPVPDDPGKTRVRLVHEGFRSGGSWDVAHQYFEKAWKIVLDRLAAYCKDGTTPW